MTSDRKYDIVLLGATGYTGKFCAEYITQNLPTSLKWAIAGRNEKKLSAIVEDLRSLNPDRASPDIEVAELKIEALNSLVQKTRVLMTTVGPYNLYGTPVFEACAKNGTHYIDCTGEVPWHREMIGKFQETALETGAIMIPQAGFDSVPADVTAWMIVNCIRQKLSKGTADVLQTVQDIQAEPSGGTIATILTMLDTYSLRWMAESRDPYCISPVPRPVETASSHPDLTSKILGVRQHPDLGILTDTPQSLSDVAVVYRSWALLGTKLYGDRFHFSNWMRANSFFRGTLIHFGMFVAGLALLLKPFRMLMTKIVTQPGSGPDLQAQKNNFVHIKALGYADEPERRRAVSVMKYRGGMYALTALFMVEAAYVVLREEKTEAHRLRGIVTPATLGQSYVERIRKAGVELTVELVD